MDILPRNEKAAATWDSAAGDYERISLHLADAIEHAIERLSPRPGERILDVGCGTGLAARRAASRGAAVVGIDLGPELIATARTLAERERLPIDFRVGDAERLPFDDASFDGIVSTFGVMFVGRPEEAARELGRVCRAGGRLALVSWTPASSVARKVAVHRAYLPPSTGPSPFDWGTPERLRQLLGESFELRAETGATTLRVASSEEAWDLFVRGYGPTRTLAESLPEARRREFRRDFLAYYDAYRTSSRIEVPREYLLAIGQRR
ncbi:MAG TPA: methyltransferase domain-containing protein [Planctomycetota bacterium]|nr:methyltransferase domain-containing protein [Planctomycetota bacterium]